MLTIDKVALQAAIKEALTGLLDVPNNARTARTKERRAPNGHDSPQADSAEWPQVPMRAGSTLADVAKRGTVKRTHDKGGRRDKTPGITPTPARTATSARTATQRAASTARDQNAIRTTAPTRAAAQEAARWFAEIDDQIAAWTPGQAPIEFDLDSFSAAFKAIFINSINKGMDARNAFNFAARKAYKNPIQY